MNRPMRNIPLWLRVYLLLACVAGWAPLAARADSILNSKHNLALTGPGTIKAATETDVCIFCHTPHRAGPELPLWNHHTSKATYTPYNSSTIKATVGQPTGSSKLCLSCHDGTVALGMVHSRSMPITMQGGVTVLPPGRTRLGTDLSDDHPVSFTYDAALAAANGQLRDPGTLTHRVRLDHNNQMQCTSCHDPHNDRYGNFLVQDNTASALCITCHTMDHWQGSAHRTSMAAWNGSGVNPWPGSKHNTVAANACQSCHAPHNAGTSERLLRFPTEEQNCFSCHSGTVASKNIAAEFNKISVHPILQTSGVHDPMEDPVNPARHVECVDCHNPHAANSAGAIAPNASGALAGVKGVNISGAVVNNVTREYELCFRCHADSVARGPARVERQFPQTNTRLEFNTANLSYHPVVGPGKNPNVPSLIAPWTPSSVMYCTDCHNNDQGTRAGGAGPNGPHGSAFVPLLERNLVLHDGQEESSAAHALCYKCHSRPSILADQSFKFHRKHVQDVKVACTTCHDPHGVPNVKHLINFNRNYATASSNGRLEYVSTGPLQGNCSLTCHGVDHNATPYSPDGFAPLMAPGRAAPGRGSRR
jgi:predicted CXXCH cytochrome family protein